MIGESLLASPLYGNDYATATKRDVYLPEGKWIDFETGQSFEGPLTLQDYSFPPEKIPVFRSEDHTSELQSLMRISYAVFCLKKKTINNKSTSSSNHDNY